MPKLAVVAHALDLKINALSTALLQRERRGPITYQVQRRSYNIDLYQV